MILSGNITNESEFKKIVESINRIGHLYWHSSGFQDREKFCALAGDWRQAFNWFLSSYAFERQGRSPHYSTSAVESVSQYSEKHPNQSFEYDIWNNFLRIGHYDDNGKGTNKKNNPLCPANDKYSSATQLVASLNVYDFNIVKWASSLAKNGEIKFAWDKLVNIRGIGKKIASLFLRDVVYAFQIDEDKIGGKIYLQPIDIWTQRGGC